MLKVGGEGGVRGSRSLASRDICWRKRCVAPQVYTGWHVLKTKAPSGEECMLGCAIRRKELT